MKRMDVFAALSEHLDDQLVVCHFGPARAEWFEASGGRPQTFFMQGGMGMASCIGLGLALALPHRKVWVFEGDGALALNLNCLLTIAAVQPSNLLHFVMSNGGYEAVGGQPLTGGGRIDFAAIARSTGIAETRNVEDIEAFRKSLPDLMDLNRYGLIDLSLDQGSVAKSKMPWDPLESKYRFSRYIEEAEQISLLTR